MLCIHKTTILCQFGLFFVTSLLTHISINSHTFMVGIISHNILAFHRVREAIAAKIIDFHLIQSEYNLSDMSSKHWEHDNIFPMIQKLLITCGPITLFPISATEEISKLTIQYTHTMHKISSHHKLDQSHNTQISKHPLKMHSITYSYILLYKSTQQKHATSTIRGE